MVRKARFRNRAIWRQHDGGEVRTRGAFYRASRGVGAGSGDRIVWKPVPRSPGSDRPGDRVSCRGGAQTDDGSRRSPAAAAPVGGGRLRGQVPTPGSGGLSNSLFGAGAQGAMTKN